ncbi:MAG: flagellar biosynthetic protein FlhB [Conexibacter sp.]|nr:flagellar biosynthetic protein FlhB [Conexibacter sp.]
MAGDNRTEKATPRHREEARRKGQVAKSPDANGALVLVAGLFAITLMGPHVISTLEASITDGLRSIAHPQVMLTGAGLNGMFRATLTTIGLTLGPIAGVCLVAGVVANVVQTGIRPTPGALKPQFSRLNPVTGARNLFGPRILFETAKSIAKLAAVGVIAYLAVAPRIGQLAGTVGISPAALGSMLGTTALGIARRAALAYLLIGLIDIAYQRYRHEKGLRMSKEDVKDEMRQQNVSAEVRGALRRRQMQAARARMMAAVPDADFVVANPTHFAVALRYDGTKPAPEIIAKGQDLIALQIRRVAEEHDVPVIENPPLARSLHASVEIGQLVPEELFQAVAQVLAHVYRVAGRKRAAG